MIVSFPAVPAHAEADTPGLRDYVRARVADSAGQIDLAAENYRNALAQAPGNADIAIRSWHQALESGDMALALQSARVLDRDGILPPNGALLLTVDTLMRKDWPAALALAERIEREENYAFLVPLLRSWISLGQNDYQPVPMDASGRFGTLTRRYIAEHTALQALARNDADTAARQLDNAVSGRTSMMPGLRITGALRLAALKLPGKALGLLPAYDPVYAATRADISAGRKLTHTPMTPAQGFGRLLFRLSQDIATDSSRGLSLALARMASFTDPANAEYRIGIARQLVSAGHGDEALVELDKAARNRWFAVMAESVRIDALRETGQGEMALALARDIAARPDARSAEQLRVANILMDRNDYAGAAQIYQHARTFYENDAIPWSLYLLEGSALERAGQWDAARAALTKAFELAPEEPIVLNYLGYAQVERGENVSQALELLKKASTLRPDDAAIADSLGWAYYMAGDVDTAIPILEKAVSGSPEDSTVNEHLGDALWAAGRRFEARYAWEAAKVFADAADRSRLDQKLDSGLALSPKKP